MLELVIWFLFVEFFGWRRLQNDKNERNTKNGNKETKKRNKETFPPKKIISSNPHTWQLRQKPIPISNIFRTELIFRKNYNYVVKIKKTSPILKAFINNDWLSCTELIFKENSNYFA